MHAPASHSRPAPPAAPTAPASGWLVAIVATLVMSVSYIDRQTLAALAPTVRGALHISREQYGTVLGAFSAAYLLGAPLAGAAMDRAGARRGLVFAVLAWSAVAAAHALVPSLAVLVAMRVLLGFAEAPSFPGAAQTIKRILPREHRSAGFGLLFTGSSIGAMIAAPLAIGIHHLTGDWRPAFVGTAAAGLLWVPLWLAVTRPQAIRDALAASRPNEPAADGGAVTGAVPSRVRLLLTAPVARAVMLVVFTAPSMMFGLNWVALYLTDVFALTQDALAKFVWIPPLVWDLGAIGFGVLASRADRRRAGEVQTHARLMIVAALLSATIIAMPFVRDPWVATLLTSTCLAGGGGVFALVTADMLARVHPAHVSTAGGLTASAQSLAYIVASPLVGRAVDQTHSYALLLVVLGALVPPAAIAWALWPVPRALAAPPPSSRSQSGDFRPRSTSIRPE